MRVLLLGGTTEASRLAVLLAGRPGFDTTLSLAGRTAAPAPSPLPMRSGGFGGVEGLAAYLRREAIDTVVDATHPFAARISTHAVAACEACGVPLVALSRAAWRPQAGDRWTAVADLDAAARHLASMPTQTVFLTIGRQGVAAFRAAPRHAYLIRAIDPPDASALPPGARVILARGPFAVEDEITLMRDQGITMLVTKNSGGTAAAGKIEAARQLGLAVLVVDRPTVPVRRVFDDPEAVLAWLVAHRPPP